jgi:hypothetical protein
MASKVIQPGKGTSDVSRRRLLGLVGATATSNP